MLRLAELALFLTPFVVFAIWRFTATEAGPSPRILLGAVCVLIALLVALVWLRQEQALPPGADYTPAELENGRVVSGHAAPQ
jgi:hypothetical protein